MTNNAPDEIYLQIGDESKEYSFDELAEVTWCKHKIYNADIKYHHDQKYQKAIEALKKIADVETQSWRRIAIAKEILKELAEAEQEGEVQE